MPNNQIPADYRGRLCLLALQLILCCLQVSSGVRVSLARKQAMAFTLPSRLSHPGAIGRPSIKASAAAAPAASPAAVQTPGTTGTVRYVQRPSTPQTELYTYLYEKPEDVSASNLYHIEKSVHVSDIRQADQTFTLQNNGFQLEKFHVEPDIDWDNEAQVRPKQDVLH